MALLIGKDNINLKDFTLSESANATEGLKKLSDHYNIKNRYQNQGLKPGTLRLVKNWDGTIQLKRTQWYHFWNSSLFGTRDTSRAETYVKSLLSKVYSIPGLESHTSRYQEIPYYQNKIEYYQKKFEPIKDFLNSEENLGPFTTKKLETVLIRHGIPDRDDIAIFNPHKIDVNLPNVTVNDAINKCLGKEGIGLQLKIGQGGMGVVKQAVVKNDKRKYVFKTEKELSFKHISDEEGLPFYQRGDLAASCLKELKHMTKPIFVIVALQKTNPSTTEYHYLPAMEAESFVKEIAQAHPNARVAIAGQLMELAPGRELFECIHGIKGDQVSFIPSGKPFKQVMQGLFTHMEIAMEHNYLHRDIKAQNVMIHKNDKDDYEVRFIDGGLAAYGRSNKLQLKNYMGTPYYMSPRVAINVGRTKNKRPYGAEVDFYSTGMLLLQMIDPSSFNKVHSKQTEAFFLQQVAGLIENPHSTKNYLGAYLEAAGANS